MAAATASVDNGNGKNKLIFLSSSPILVKEKKIKVGNTELHDLHPAILDTEQEWEAVCKPLKEANLNLEVEHRPLTEKSLRKAVKDDPQVLHISGHGEDDDARGGALAPEGEGANADRGERLYGDQFFNTDDDEFKRNEDRNLQLVVLSNCHSEAFAKYFLALGVTSVVCIKKNEEATDDFSPIMFGQFYEKLALRLGDIEWALDQAQSHLGQIGKHKAEQQYEKMKSVAWREYAEKMRKRKEVYLKFEKEHAKEKKKKAKGKSKKTGTTDSEEEEKNSDDELEYGFNTVGAPLPDRQPYEAGPTGFIRFEHHLMLAQGIKKGDEAYKHMKFMTEEQKEADIYLLLPKGSGDTLWNGNDYRSKGDRIHERPAFTRAAWPPEDEALPSDWPGFTDKTHYPPHANTAPPFTRFFLLWDVFREQRDYDVGRLLRQAADPEGPFDQQALFGEAGVGKTWVLRWLAHYANSRRLWFPGGVFYIDCKERQAGDTLALYLGQQLQGALPDHLHPQNLVLDKDSALTWVKGALQKATEGDKPALLLIDHMEAPNGQMFGETLQAVKHDKGLVRTVIGCRKQQEWSGRIPPRGFQELEKIKLQTPLEKMFKRKGGCALVVLWDLGFQKAAERAWFWGLINGNPGKLERVRQFCEDKGLTEFEKFKPAWINEFPHDKPKGGGGGGGGGGAMGAAYDSDDGDRRGWHTLEEDSWGGGHSRGRRRGGSRRQRRRLRELEREHEELLAQNRDYRAELAAMEGVFANVGKVLYS